jgi:hypothetical protein
MTASSPGREVDAGTARTLADAYRQLVKAGNDSVRAAWRFGQCLDSFTDAYTRLELADAMSLSISTIQRYLKFYRVYQRPELAEQAARQLESYNIDVITELQTQLHPVGHTSLAGRRFRYRCASCHSLEVGREEFDPDTDQTLEPA